MLLVKKYPSKVNISLTAGFRERVEGPPHRGRRRLHEVLPALCLPRQEVERVLRDGRDSRHAGRARLCLQEDTLRQRPRSSQPNAGGKAVIPLHLSNVEEVPFVRIYRSESSVLCSHRL